MTRRAADKNKTFKPKKKHAKGRQALHNYAKTQALQVPAPQPFRVPLCASFHS